MFGQCIQERGQSKFGGCHLSIGGGRRQCQWSQRIIHQLPVRMMTDTDRYVKSHQHDNQMVMPFENSNKQLFIKFNKEISFVFLTDVHDPEILILNKKKQNKKNSPCRVNLSVNYEVPFNVLSESEEIAKGGWVRKRRNRKTRQSRHSKILMSLKNSAEEVQKIVFEWQKQLQKTTFVPKRTSS